MYLELIKASTLPPKTRNKQEIAHLLYYYIKQWKYQVKWNRETKISFSTTSWKEVCSVKRNGWVTLMVEVMAFTPSVQVDTDEG